MIRKLTFVVLLVVGLWGGLSVRGTAQTPTPNEVNEISKGLWCPLCK
jgi:hypothetical protein